MAIYTIEKEEFEEMKRDNKAPSESNIKMSLGGYRKNVLRGGR